MLDAVRDRIVILNSAGRLVYTNAAARGDFNGELSAILASSALHAGLKELASAGPDRTLPLRIAPDVSRPNDQVEMTLMRAPNGVDIAVIVHARNSVDGGVSGETVAELLREHIAQPLRAFLAVSSPNAQEAGTQLLSQLEKVADLIALFANDALVGDERILPAPLMEEATQAVAGVAQKQRVRISLKGFDIELPPLYGSRRWLVRALREVLENAVIHARTDMGSNAAPPTVEVSGTQSGSHLQIVCRNTGALPAGLGAHGKLVAFASAAGHATNGLGIGLPLAQRIVELHGGMLRIRSDAEGMTEVTLQLPTGAPHRQSAQVDMEQARRYAEDLARVLAQRKPRSTP